MLSADVLAKQILAAMVENVRKIDPAAKQVEFQEKLAKAAAKGIVQTMQSFALVTGPGVAPAAGPGSGIRVPNPQLASDLAVEKMSGSVGGQGPAMKPMMDGVLIPACRHLSNARLTSISGFGGTPTTVTGWSASQLSKLIAAEMGDLGSAGPAMIEAIAHGFTKAVQSTGIPGSIPAGGTPAGPIVAKVA